MKVVNNGGKYIVVYSKKLEDMTLEELWELFPVVLMPHQFHWKEWAEEEICSLEKTLSAYSPVCHHIGSSAIPGICAKPIIDILIEIAPVVDRLCVRKALECAGYICMSESVSRQSFNKGYTLSGFAEKVFHVHIHNTGDNDEIYFRDYLIDNPSVAHEYEVLKHSLLPEYKHNRDGYTAAKSDFIRQITAIARLGKEQIK